MEPTPEATDAGVEVQLDGLFECLAIPERRHVLGLLYERAPGSLTLRDLATFLVPAYRERPQDAATGEQVARALGRLRHTHLPKLHGAGLIDLGRETASCADHPAFDDGGIVSVLGGEPAAEVASLDTLFAALADPHRRTILDVLSHQFGPIHLETLARAIEARERDVPESAVDDTAVEDRLVGLRHRHLPRLSSAGVIEYDAEEGSVEYRGHPALRVPWMHSVLEPGFRSSLTGESTPEGIGTLRGRERIVSFGQSLCDRVDEELFCMFTDTDLLEAGCLTRLRDASRERDATVYLGTGDPVIRDYVREQAPSVILWEPSTNWLTLPVAGSRVGRLLLADREAVMIGTLNENDDEERADPDEQAIIGEGADNALVVMVTQLLGPHLEAIDSQPDAVEAELPF